MRARLFRTGAVLALLLLVGSCATLNATGVCWAERRYLSKEERIDLAIKSHVTLGAEWPYAYRDAADFRARNPDCCFDQGQRKDAWALLGFRVFDVYLRYRRPQSEAPEPGLPYYEAYLSQDACGGHLDFQGMSLSAREYGAFRR